MQGIFISYRRQDSQSAAGRLADHVKEHMAGVPVFRDVETIEPGVDFSDAINRALQSCGVLLAVIGPHWVSATDAAGRRRLDNPNDYTRLEITTALARPNVLVIPVLVEGAQMPEPADLPEDMQALCRRNATELTDKRWNFDVSQLIVALRKALDLEPPAPGPRPEPHPQPGPPPVQPPWYRRLSKLQWGGIAAAVVVVGILAGQESEPLNPGPISSPVPVTPYPQPTPVQPLPVPSAVSRPGFNGEWQDGQGGRYRLTEQGDRYRFESTSGQSGVGWVVNNVLTLDYLYNNIRYGAQLEISADGNWLRGRYASAVTGESGPVALQRVL